MNPDKAHLRELLFGPMRANIVATGIELGVFEVLDNEPTSAHELSEQLAIDTEYGYRLFRALAYIGVLTEESNRMFSMTAAGEYLTTDHPQTFKDYFLLETSQMNQTLWSYLPTLIEKGEQNTFEREFGQPLFEYLEANPEVALMFNRAMESYSRLHTVELQELLAGIDVPDDGHVCDLGGGHGYLLCMLLAANPDLTGTVVDRPAIINEEDAHLASEFGVVDRCSYEVADMFASIPSADVYLLKHILHDWTDAQASALLTTIRDHAPPDAQIILIEHVFPNTAAPHLASLYDVQMIAWTQGRERTVAEYTELLTQSGWTAIETQFTENELLGAVHAMPA